MKEFKRVFRYGVLSVKGELRRVNLYLVLFFTFLIIKWNLGGLPAYLANSKGQMHVFELYVHFLTSPKAQIIYLLGIMAVSCGSLFYSNGATYYLIRGNRRRWALGQAVYLLIMMTGYNLFLLFSLCFSTGGHLTLANKWSRASVLAERLHASAIGCRAIFDVYGSVMKLSPVSAGLITFLLAVLLGMAGGMVMICFGTRSNGVFGAVVMVGVWYADIVVKDISYFSKARYLSPAGLARISEGFSLAGGAGILYAVVFFCILIAIEFYVLMKSAKKVDFMKLE